MRERPRPEVRPIPEDLQGGPLAAGDARPVLVGVFLVWMAVLVLQIALTRIFSFTIGYHFASVTISVALLGYGASPRAISTPSRR